MLSLVCKAQSYDWGRKGDSGSVGRLHRENSKSDIDNSVPYAELWVGTHPNGPSIIRDQAGATLSEYISKDPSLLGPIVRQRFGDGLPFLLKVLSVQKALSIQAHPDIPLAKKLHAERPEHYKDPNHKPEMAIALGAPFEALCGFVTTEVLRERLQAYPELREAAGEAASSAYLAATEGTLDDDARKAALKPFFTALMTQEKEVVKTALSALLARLNSEKETRELSTLEQLVPRLDEQYPGGDVGVFAAFVLNHVFLQPGEGIFLAANEPHAYLSGECVEIMATSDNVVRAGLTPKFRDTDTLCSMLTYNQGVPTTLQGEALDEYARRYSPPIDEFELDVIEVPGLISYTLQKCPGPSVLFVYQGSGEAEALVPSSTDAKKVPLQQAEILFVPAESTVTVSATDKLHLFRAGCSSRILA